MGIQFKHTIALLAILASCNLFASGIQYKQLTMSEAIELSSTSGKPIFLDFYTSNCPACKKLDHGTLSNPDLVDLLNSSFIPIKINADTPDGKALATSHGVRSFPTVLMIDQANNLVERIIGVQDKAVFILKGRQMLDPENHELYILHERYSKGERGEEFISEYIRELKSRSMDCKSIAADFVNSANININNAIHLEIIEAAELNEKHIVIKELIEGFDQSNSKQVDILLSMSIRVYERSFKKRNVQLIQDFAERNRSMFERLTGVKMDSQDIINYLSEMHKVLII